MPAADNFLLEPVPHEEAARWIAGKPLVSREVFNELLPELKARAFLINGLEDANVASEVRELIAELPRGGEWVVQKKAIAEKLSGWFDPAGALARAEMLLRTHGFQAYRTSSHAVMERQADVFPFWQLLTMDDEKVRHSHRAWHEIIAPADSSFWDDKPGGWGCRCQKVALLPEEVDDTLQDDAGKPLEEQRVLDGARLKRAEEGSLIRAVRDENGKLLRDPIHPWNVANPDMIGVPQSLRIDPAQLKARYDEETWSEFEARAKSTEILPGQTVWGWLHGKKLKKAA